MERIQSANLLFSTHGGQAGVKQVSRRRLGVQRSKRGEQDKQPWREGFQIWIPPKSLLDGEFWGKVSALSKFQ